MNVALARKSAATRETVARATVCREHPVAADRHSILILTRGRDVARDIEQALRLACRGNRIYRACTLEDAVQSAGQRGFGVAFLGCDLPDAVFRHVHGFRRCATRVIGVRECGGTLPAIRLMSNRLISAYVSLPATVASLQALVRPPPHQALASMAIKTAAA